MYKNVVTTSLRAGTRNTLARGTRYTNAVRNTHACAQRNAVRAAQGNSVLRVAVKAGWKSAVGLGCLVGFGALAPIICDEPVDTSKVKETSTGIEFPTKLEGPLYGNLSLCGFGVRYVTFLKFKVYAVGLYVDMASAKKVVGNTTDGNEAMQKVLEIAAARQVSWGHLMTGMIPGLKTALKAESDKEVETLIAPLRNCLRETVKFEKGETVDFIRKGVDSVDVIVNDKLLYTMKSKFTQAFFEMYLSQKSRVPQARDVMVADLQKQLSQ